MVDKVWMVGVLVATISVGPVSWAQGRDVTDRSQESIEAAIRAVHAEMRQAAEALDAAALYAHVLDTDTPPIIEDGRLALTRAAAQEGTEDELRGLSRLTYTYDHERITVISPNTALWVGAGKASAELADGRQIVAPFAETILYVLREGNWKVLHAHRSTPNR